MNITAAKLGTYLLTNAHTGLKLGENAGISKFSIQCTSTTAITILGTRRLVATADSGSIDLPSVPIPISENALYNWSKESGIKEITIAIPVGATAKLTVL